MALSAVRIAEAVFAIESKLDLEAPMWEQADVHWWPLYRTELYRLIVVAAAGDGSRSRPRLGPAFKCARWKPTFGTGSRLAGLGRNLVRRCRQPDHRTFLRPVVGAMSVAGRVCARGGPGPRALARRNRAHALDRSLDPARQDPRNAGREAGAGSAAPPTRRWRVAGGTGLRRGIDGPERAANAVSGGRGRRLGSPHRAVPAQRTCSRAVRGRLLRCLGLCLHARRGTRGHSLGRCAAWGDRPIQLGLCGLAAAQAPWRLLPHWFWTWTQADADVGRAGFTIAHAVRAAVTPSWTLGVTGC